MPEGGASLPPVVAEKARNIAMATRYLLLLFLIEITITLHLSDLL
jgi:hypothetical protein